MNYSSPRTPRTPRTGYNTPGTPGYGIPQGKRTIMPTELPDLSAIEISGKEIILPPSISKVESSGANSCIYESDICSTELTSKQYISKVVTEEEAKKIIRSNDIIKTIPKYQEYFLLPEFSCKLKQKPSDCTLENASYVFRIEQARPIDNAGFKKELNTIIKKNPESDTFIKLKSEVRTALIKLHDNGLLHGDIINAINIVYHNNKFKLIDFSEIKTYKQDQAAEELSRVEQKLKESFGIKKGAEDRKRGRSSPSQLF